MAKVFVATPHGGGDPGAVGGGVGEVDLVPPIVNLYADYLRQAGVEVEVFTAQGDTDDALAEVVSASNGFQPDLTIQIHMNASESVDAHGVESWIVATGWHAEEWASKIQAHLAPAYFADRGVKVGNYIFVKDTVASAVLLELGFITNIGDRTTVIRHRDAIAKAIGDATLAQLGISPLPQPEPPPEPSPVPSEGRTFYRVIVEGVQTGSYVQFNNAISEVVRNLKEGRNVTVEIYREP